jgi:hypothetical protein
MAQQTLSSSLCPLRITEFSHNTSKAYFPRVRILLSHVFCRFLPSLGCFLVQCTASSRLWRLACVNWPNIRVFCHFIASKYSFLASTGRIFASWTASSRQIDRIFASWTASSLQIRTPSRQLAASSRQLTESSRLWPLHCFKLLLLHANWPIPRVFGRLQASIYCFPA